MTSLVPVSRRTLLVHFFSCSSFQARIQKLCRVATTLPFRTRASLCRGFAERGSGAHRSCWNVLPVCGFEAVYNIEIVSLRILEDWELASWLERSRIPSCGNRVADCGVSFQELKGLNLFGFVAVDVGGRTLVNQFRNVSPAGIQDRLFHFLWVHELHAGRLPETRQGVPE